MRLRLWLARAAIVGAGSILALGGGLVSPGFADPVPSPSPVSVSVTIPGTPSPSPSSTGSSATGSSGGVASGSGSSGSGSGSSGQTSQLPTEAFGAPTPAAEPFATAPGLMLDHERISNGEWLIATGTGFAAGENVQFVFYPGAVVIGTVAANASGTVLARFPIPADMRPGGHVVEATGWSSKRIENKDFTVVSASASIPFLWWVLVVLGVLLVGLTVMSWYFRTAIARWFDKPLVPAES